MPAPIGQLYALREIDSKGGLWAPIFAAADRTVSATLVEIREVEWEAANRLDRGTVLFVSSVCIHTIPGGAATTTNGEIDIIDSAGRLVQNLAGLVSPGDLSINAAVDAALIIGEHKIVGHMNYSAVASHFARLSWTGYAVPKGNVQLY